MNNCPENAEPWQCLNNKIVTVSTQSSYYCRYAFAQALKPTLDIRAQQLLTNEVKMEMVDTPVLVTTYICNTTLIMV